MRLTFYILLLATIQGLAIDSYAQATKLNLTLSNTTVKQVLSEIEEMSEFYFLYNSKIVDVERKVSVNFKNKKIDKALDLLFKNTRVNYNIVDRQIVLSDNESTGVSTFRAQQKSITGKVTDEGGLPLPGVTVAVKGTTQGTVTDMDGDYSLSGVSEGTTLVFSFVGMLTQEIIVGAQTNIDVTMQVDTIGIEEVVAIGYGTQKKVNLTGSVATVSGSTMVKRSSHNPESLLQGLLSGVNVTESNGQPGDSRSNILIRGMGTFSGAGVSPLILIDGVPGSLTSLNPSSIESVSVLKDAASASIYGSRGANGVILVTTKNGKSTDGKLSVEYDFNYAILTPTRLPDLVTNSADYMRAYNTNVINSNYGVERPEVMYPQSEIDKYENATDRHLYPNFDWFDYMINPAPRTIHTLSISGGSQTKYNLSLGYTDEKGTLKSFSYKKFDARLNIISEISKRFKAGAIFNFKNGNTEGTPSWDTSHIDAENFFLCLFSQMPLYKPMLADGSPYYTRSAYDFDGPNWNPYFMAYKFQESYNKNWVGSGQVWTDLEIMKGLNWYTKLAVSGSFFDNKAFSGKTEMLRLYRDVNTSTGYKNSSYLIQDITINLYKNFYTYLNYKKTIGQHNLGAMVGASYEDNHSNFVWGRRNSFTSNVTPELSAGSESAQFNNGSSSEWAIASLFGRLNYNFQNKYLLEANVRYDGTSRLAPEKRWGIFPSFSAGWILSEESFMENTKSWLSFLKIRASWGLLGNQNIGTYPYQGILSYTGSYPFNGTNLTTGVAQTSLNNRNLVWEKTTTTNLGLDLTFFEKLSLTAELYKKYTTDILRDAQVNALVGLSAPVINSGEMQNIGIDLDMNYYGYVQKGALKGLKWNAGLIFSAFKNELVKFGTPEISGTYIREEGRPWNTFYLLEVEGIFQSMEEINSSPKQFGDNTQPGTLKFKDVSGDGIVDNNDRVPMEKGAFPDFTYGIRASAEWKNFDLYAFSQGVQGSRMFATRWGIQPFKQRTAPTVKQLAEAWTPENHSTTMVMLGDPISYRKNSTYLLKDNSYLRLKSVQLGYTLPDKWLGHIGLQKVRVYLAGDNLLTFTKYEGLDPERSVTSGRYVSYPMNKTISFGLNVIF